ncbi:MAG TPA: thiol-disulfide oxidoreductase DCC family protein [Dongiaceae bacterium]|jgi:predicted DCC family thiol-disulfide oxidoreductase YuxK|nr:thiol-disulfide oxidoreductase DCC family protein [Dongiaceae bacterium]
MPPPRALSAEDLAAADLTHIAKPVIVFDGVCHLCTGFAKFVIRHDPDGRFLFLAAQSARGEALYRRLGYKTDDWDSNLLVLEGRVHTELDAAIEITRRFGGFWRLTPILYVLPRPLRDWLYNRIARNRYDWFGKREVCFMPTPELMSRFLG